jgi:hypothetical protein
LIIPALIVVLMTLFLLTGLGCRKRQPKATMSSRVYLVEVFNGTKKSEVKLGQLPPPPPPLEEVVTLNPLSPDLDYTVRIEEKYNPTPHERRLPASANRKTKAQLAFLRLPKASAEQ